MTLSPRSIWSWPTGWFCQFHQDFWSSLEVSHINLFFSSCQWQFLPIFPFPHISSVFMLISSRVSQSFPSTLSPRTQVRGSIRQISSYPFPYSQLLSFCLHFLTFAILSTPLSLIERLTFLLYLSVESALILFICFCCLFDQLVNCCAVFIIGIFHFLDVFMGPTDHLLLLLTMCLNIYIISNSSINYWRMQWASYSFENILCINFLSSTFSSLAATDFYHIILKQYDQLVYLVNDDLPLILYFFLLGFYLILQLTVLCYQMFQSPIKIFLSI